MKNEDFLMKNSYLDWLKANDDPKNLCDPPLDAQSAINFLCNYLLGEDWYVVMPESTQQVNSVIVYEILQKYSKDFRKELKQYARECKINAKK